jgi:hypothetical protein
MGADKVRDRRGDDRAREPRTSRSDRGVDHDRDDDRLGNQQRLRMARNRRGDAELETLRARIGATWPHLATQLTREQLLQIQRVEHARAVNRGIAERDAAARQRQHQRHGAMSRFLSEDVAELERINAGSVSLDATDLYMELPMDQLLDPSILALQERAIVPEQRFRIAAWDALRAGRARVQIEKGDEVSLTLWWLPADGDRWYAIPATRGGLVGFDELLAIGGFRRWYQNEVLFGPEYQYLMQYHDALQGEILDWQEQARFLNEKADDHPIVYRISFWIQWDEANRPPSAAALDPAAQSNDEAHAAILDRRFEEAAALLTDAETRWLDIAKRIQSWDESSLRGTVRALKVLTITKEAGKLAAGVLTGRGPLAAGQFARAALYTGLGTGAYTFGQEMVGQGAAVAQGVQDDIDLGGAAIRSGKDALIASVATWTGIRATRFVQGWLRPWVLRTPMPDFVRRQMPEVLGGALASPAATATDVALSAITGEGRVPGSVGELAGMVVDDITTGALLQVGLSPVFGRLDGKTVTLPVPPGDAYARGGRGVITLYHGGPMKSVESLDKGINTAKNADPHDFGPGFYTSSERAAGEAYAQRGHEKTGEPGAIAEVHVRTQDLGRIVDVRPGGAHRKAWEDFLASPMVPGISWSDMIPTNADMRPYAFETFLRQSGLADADTIFGPIGDAYTAGTTGGATTQIAIRSAAVAAHLDRLGLGWMAPRPTK